MGERKALEFEIVRKVGVLSERSKGWRKELNLVSWADREPKYDIREWKEDHSQMGRGVTLTVEELQTLRDVIDAEIASLGVG